MAFTSSALPPHVLLTSGMALQGYLTKLEMGNLVSAGMLSVNVLFSNDIQVRLHFPHPASRSGMVLRFAKPLDLNSPAPVSSFACECPMRHSLT